MISFSIKNEYNENLSFKSLKVIKEEIRFSVSNISRFFIFHTKMFTLFSGQCRSEKIII